MNYLERIESLHPDIIGHYLETGCSKAIPDDLQIMITQLCYAIEIWDIERNVARAAKLLKTQIKVRQGITLGIMACKQRINDSLMYFSINNSVSNKFWYLNAADKFEDLVKLAIAANKLTEAGRFHEKAAEYRIKANAEISITDMLPPVFLISDKMTLEDLGFEKKNLKEIARKHNDGFYVSLITQLPGLDKNEKKKLMYDAGVEDANIIDEIDNDGPK